MTTPQGLLQKWLRGQTGKAFDFNGDMLAFLKQEGYPSTFGYNGALIKYLKAQLSLANNETISLNDLQYRFAISQGKRNWNAVTALVSNFRDFMFADGNNFYFADGNNYTFNNG